MSQTRIFKVSELTEKTLLEAAQDISRGAVAVVPTDTVYGMGTGAFCEESIVRIYQIKNRPATSALQILIPSLAAAKQVAQFTPQAEKLAAACWPGGLTAILPAIQAGQPLLRGFKGLGLRVPGNPFLVSLLEKMTVPMACTSANLHGQPTLTEEKTLLGTFDGKADYIFLGGTLSPTASSVVDLTGAPRLLREGGISRARLEELLGENFVQEDDK